MMKITIAAVIHKPMSGEAYNGLFPIRKCAYTHTGWVALGYINMSITLILLYLLANVFAVVLIAYLLILVNRYGASPSRRAIIMVLVVTHIAILANTLSIVSPTEALAEFFHRPMRLSAATLVPPVYLLFLLIFSDFEKWRSAPILFLLFGVGGISIILLLGDPVLNLYTGAYTMTRFGPFYLRTAWEPGDWFPIASTYNYILMGSGLLLCIVQIFRTRDAVRRQYVLFLMAAVIPISLSVLDTYRLVPPEFQLSSIGLTFMSLILYWAMRQMRAMDFLPVAWQAVVSQMNDAVIVIDQRLAIRSLNPAAQTMFGLDDSMLGIDVTTLMLDNEHLVEEFLPIVRGSREIRVRRDNGATQDFDLIITPLEDLRKRIVGRVLILREITARKNAERERESLIQELQSYAHTVAHDLKNPVSGIVGYLDFALSSDDWDDPDNRFAVNRALSLTYKMVEIINTLLLFSRLRDETEVTYQPLNMAAIVEDALDRNRVAINEVETTIVIPESWPVAVGHAPWIEAIWANYISNAVKYGGRPLEMNFGAEIEGSGLVRYWLRDNGPGIPADRGEGLFGEWEQIDASQQTGHGLGLSICRRIAERHGGTVGVESVVGEGSTFYFTLPVAE